MPTIYDFPFQPIRGSTAPSFEVSADEATAFAFKLESSGVRDWPYPNGRVIRLACSTAADYYAMLSSASAVMVASAAGPLFLGGTVEILRVQPHEQFISFLGATTAVTVNVTLGVGQ